MAARHTLSVQGRWPRATTACSPAPYSDTPVNETQGSPDAPLPSSPPRCHPRPGVSPASVAGFMLGSHQTRGCTKAQGTPPAPRHTRPEHNTALLPRGCGFLPLSDGAHVLVFRWPFVRRLRKTSVQVAGDHRSVGLGLRVSPTDASGQAANFPPPNSFLRSRLQRCCPA